VRSAIPALWANEWSTGRDSPRRVAGAPASSLMSSRGPSVIALKSAQLDKFAQPRSLTCLGSAVQLDAIDKQHLQWELKILALVRLPNILRSIK